jgi:hypothetical protein
MPSRNQHSDASTRPTRVSRRQAQEARAELAAGGLDHDERRRLHSIIRVRELAESRRSGKRRHALIVVTGALAVMAVVAVTSGLIPAIATASGHGTNGFFVLGYQRCSLVGGRSSVCMWVGSFQGRNGTTIPGVTYAGKLPAAVAPEQRIAARYFSGQVFPRQGSHGWPTGILLVIFAGAAVAAFLWLTPLGTRRQPRRLSHHD